MSRSIEELASMTEAIYEWWLVSTVLAYRPVDSNTQPEHSYVLFATSWFLLFDVSRKVGDVELCFEDVAELTVVTY
jgi:hypothetical protein